MNVPPLVILGYSEAGMFMRGLAGSRVEAIISIHGSREFGIETEVPHRIDLTFDDVDVAIPGDMVAMDRENSRRRWAQENGLVEVAPTKADAAAIIEFARKIAGISGIVLCHCGGGVSRAPAAALLCLATWTGLGVEKWCVEEVYRLRRGASPHVGLVHFADELLNRNGRLLEAIAPAQRGE